MTSMRRLWTGQGLSDHCLDCPAWAEARDRLDLHCMEDMVTYFRRVLKGREDKEKERRRRRTE